MDSYRLSSGSCAVENYVAHAQQKIMASLSATKAASWYRSNDLSASGFYAAVEPAANSDTKSAEDVIYVPEMTKLITEPEYRASIRWKRILYMIRLSIAFTFFSGIRSFT